ncbi:TlpA family protein disulfide reductase [Blastococcus sp. CT_GayMR19]|uniref:TlpA family protein disulfide reductase n=1 Tax=Blastococcus sp. CT_GayMR19 TaxID=2559608 RepID=UPI0010732961|nr:TlpA disulfide reductase family protein [Blastococcus sp. CT_GayMR19]TFV73424.1 TlpA family protein disulfide reductase [Blastococcus sp. CT_GayMR19]
MTRARLVTAGVALTAALSGCTAGPDAPDSPPAAESALLPCPEQGDEPAAGGGALPALSFSCPGGGELDLARAPGTPTVVNLWGSWCGPCREELPLLQEFADGAGDRVRVLGVISKDGLPQAESFAADAGVTFASAFDGEGELMAELGLNGLPYTAFLDADGRLVHSELGPVESADELRGLVAEHLGVPL